jgi:SAM-dependent methyltransferase
MMDKDFSTSTEILYDNELNNPKAIRNREETINLLLKNRIHLHGKILDIGERNLFTEQLENLYDVKIYNTYGDLDVEFNAPLFKYDFVHYNNVIEHQFNPLFTLLKIREVLKPEGILILGTPVKPTWITFAKCHFHEFDQYRFDKLIQRAGFAVIDKVHFWHDIKLLGIRGILGSFWTKQAIYLLKNEL